MELIEEGERRKFLRFGLGCAVVLFVTLVKCSLFSTTFAGKCVCSRFSQCDHENKLQTVGTIFVSPELPGVPNTYRYT